MVLEPCSWHLCIFQIFLWQAAIFSTFSRPFYPSSEQENDNDDGSDDITYVDNSRYCYLREIDEMFNGETGPDDNLTTYFQLSNNTHCAAHRLQLIVKDVMDNHSTFKGLRQVLFNLFTKPINI